MGLGFQSWAWALITMIMPARLHFPLPPAVAAAFYLTAARTAAAVAGGRRTPLPGHLHWPPRQIKIETFATQPSDSGLNRSVTGGAARSRREGSDGDKAAVGGRRGGGGWCCRSCLTKPAPLRLLRVATPIMKLACVLLLLVFLGFGDFAYGSGSEAYVTLLYGDEFLLGIRVLGKSIRDSGSSKDMVVLVSDGVSGRAKAQLKADGWIIEAISLLANPTRVHPTRFWGVYTKLKIFNLTKYKKVVYLDADTIVVKNIDDLFKCGKFCANLKHSERLNSGVMVVEPSETVFDDMMKKVNTLPSYTGGDQGFLNSYYTGFANAHLFDPDLSFEVRNSQPVPEMERLSTLYNADVGLYMLANKWMVDEGKLRVIHYTLGPLKPWDWWTAWLLKPVDVWQDVRIRLEESLPGTGGGRNPDDQFLVKILFILPFCILFLFHYRFFLQHRDLFCTVCRISICDSVRHLWYKFKSSGGLRIYSAVGVSSSSIINSSHQFSNGNHFKHPASLGGISIFVSFTTVLASLGVAFAVIPRQVIPSTGLLLVYEWTFVLFFLIFGMYLRLVYKWGKATVVQSGAFASRVENSDYDYSKGHERHASMCDSAAWFYGLGMALLAIIAPLLPSFLGITALFAKLGLMVAGVVVLASFMTYAAEHLAIRAFFRGREDRDQP